MERLPVQSSTVAEVGYDGSTMTLEVAFHSGSTYQYLDVPETVYREFLSAASLGKYLNAFIKNNYRCVKL